MTTLFKEKNGPKEMENGELLFLGTSMKEVMKTIKSNLGTNYEEKYEIKQATEIRNLLTFWRKDFKVIMKEKEMEREKTILKVDEQKRKAIRDIVERKTVVSEKKEEKKEENLQVILEEIVKNLKQTNAEKEENPVLADFYKRLVEAEADDEVAKSIIEEVKTRLRPEDVNNKKKVEKEILSVIENEVNVYGELDFDHIHTFALVGPTGAGKTTTLVKIAAGLKLRHQKTVGLITTDIYKVGAIEQLQKYAGVLKSSMFDVKSPRELKAAIDYFRFTEPVDVILIDTMGRNLMDTELIEDIKNYLEIAQPDHTGLVLASTQKNSDIKRIIHNFSEVNVQSLIFTKLDETMSHGALLNIAKQTKLGISYITDGQDVPEDIYTASKEGIAKKIFYGVSDFGSSFGIASVNE